MRNVLFIFGALLLVAGLLMAGGKLKYEDTDKVVDLGKVEINATHEKTAPLNWGYVLLGGGALLIVGGALAKR